MSQAHIHLMCIYSITHTECEVWPRNVDQNDLMFSYLCSQQSGRSLASPARRRGSRPLVHHICIHVTWETTTVHLRHDIFTTSKDEPVERLNMTTIITTQRGQHLVESRRSSSGQAGGGGGRLWLKETIRQNLMFPCPPPLSLPSQPSASPPAPAEDITSWRTVHSLPDGRMSLCKHSFCPTLTIKRANILNFSLILY